MTRLANACVSTRRASGYEYPEIDADAVEAFIADKHRASGTSAASFSVAGMGFCLETGTTSSDFAEIPWGSRAASWTVLPGSILRVHTKATSTTSTTVSAVSLLLRASARDHLLKRLSPARRAMFDQVKRLREEMGVVSFKIGREIRELRSHD